MSRLARHSSVGLVFCALVMPAVATRVLGAPIVWTGPKISFSKASGADPLLPANQDHLTANVALARGNTQGIYNILQEAGFTNSSPADTRWATGLNNPGDAIAATNWAALDFTNWVAAYGNAVTTNTVLYDAVVHLVTDDVYLDLRFTNFQGGTPGGAFAYERSTPVPEPTVTTAVLSLLAVFSFGRYRSKSAAADASL